MGPLTSERYTTKDLELFGYLLSVNEKGNKVTFSLLDRPSSITTSRISLFDRGYQDVWDELMNHMARWLLRHINNPKLILWLSKYGKCLNRKFMQMLQGAILSTHDNIDKEMLNIWHVLGSADIEKNLD